jgi:hypothetical protein|tara:strand:- start:370893 stop:371321 length:429 start_codon:yes stop_codon:yes gene_type:complete
MIIIKKIIKNKTSKNGDYIMAFDCNCHGFNFQREFNDAAEAHERINAALDNAFETLGRPRPAPEDLREELLANAGAAYELVYTEILDRAPGCMRVCTNTLLYIIDNAGQNIDDSTFTELRSATPPDDVVKSSDARRDNKRII